MEARGPRREGLSRARAAYAAAARAAIIFQLLRWNEIKELFSVFARIEVLLINLWSLGRLFLNNFINLY